MVNVRLFREKAEYKDGRKSDLSGREAYSIFVTEIQPLIKNITAKARFAGDVTELEVDDLFDRIAIVEYPPLKAFMTMVKMPRLKHIVVFGFINRLALE